MYQGNTPDHNRHIWSGAMSLTSWRNSLNYNTVVTEITDNRLQRGNGDLRQLAERDSKQKLRNAMIIKQQFMENPVIL